MSWIVASFPNRRQSSGIAPIRKYASPSSAAAAANDGRHPPTSPYLADVFSMALTTAASTPLFPAHNINHVYHAAEVTG